jgi:hypothetical protein
MKPHEAVSLTRIAIFTRRCGKDFTAEKQRLRETEGLFL